MIGYGIYGVVLGYLLYILYQIQREPKTYKKRSRTKDLKPRKSYDMYQLTDADIVVVRYEYKLYLVNKRTSSTRYTLEDYRDRVNLRLGLSKGLTAYTKLCKDVYL